MKTHSSLKCKETLSIIIIEKFLAQKKDLWIAFVDLEKAFNRVPRDRVVVGVEAVRS